VGACQSVSTHVLSCSYLGYLWEARYLTPLRMVRSRPLFLFRLEWVLRREVVRNSFSRPSFMHNAFVLIYHCDPAARPCAPA